MFRSNSRVRIQPQVPPEPSEGCARFEAEGAHADFAGQSQTEACDRSESEGSQPDRVPCRQPDPGSTTAQPEAAAARARTRFLNIWALVGGIALAAVAVYLLKILALPVSIAVWTLVFVFCLRGLVNWIERRGLNRLAATSLAYVALFAVLAAIGFLLFSPVLGLGSQLENLAASLPGYAEGLAAWAGELSSRYSGVLDNATVKNLIDEAGKSLSSWAGNLARGSAEGLVVAGSTVASTALAVGFALVIAFWILMQLPAIGRECLRVIGPDRADEALFIERSFARIMDGYIKGTLLQCAVIGVATAVLLAATGVPDAAALGAVTGLLNVIPIVGPWLGGALAAVVALFVSPWAALVVIAGVVLITHVVYAFVSPKIMQSSVDVHPALTLFALVCGSALGGAAGGLPGSLVGMLAAIPAVALAKVLFVYYFERRTGRSVAASDGVFLK